MKDNKMRYIRVNGARKHNLKNVSVSLPKNQIIAFTGVSGSGKSTLAYDIIFSEGSSKYLDAISNDIANDLREAEVEGVEGILPAIACRQVTSFNNNIRSTVATVTEMGTFLRILFSEYGIKGCPKCGGDCKPADSACPHCGELLKVMKGPMFSYNTPMGMCTRCQGTGIIHDFSVDLIVPEPDKPIQAQPWGKDATTIFKYVSIFFESLAETYHYDYNTPFSELSKEQQKIILYGTGGKQIKHHDKKKGSILSYVYHGIIPQLSKAYETNKTESRIESIKKYMKQSVCPHCEGTRFRREVRQVRLGDLTIDEWFNTEIVKLIEVCGKLVNDFKRNKVGYFALQELYKRLTALDKFGLGYLTLGRGTGSLSGGELHHIRLAKHMNTNFGGIIFILDEPTSGLHEKDRDMIVDVMKKLKEMGNTVIVVDHCKKIIENADYIVDMGPAGGEKGGEVCFCGSFKEFKKSDTLTAKYIRNELRIAVPAQRRRAGRFIEFCDISVNNIRGLSVSIPLDIFAVVTGVSGSGKSSLIVDALYPELRKNLGMKADGSEYLGRINGDIELDNVVVIDQSPIGRMVRSNLATYVEVFDEIRKLYASLEDAKKSGITPNQLSFNVEGGRCNMCDGMGVVKRNVYFLHEVFCECPQCKGQRYQDYILDLQYKGLNISQILNLTIEEALVHFNGNNKITRSLSILDKIGLGYMKLGQPTSTFSGGEAQRLKLGKYLSKEKSGKTLYIFDEPTTGLHFDDLNRFIGILQELVDKGNSVICIEHNLELIKTADYVIELGPEGGNNGGRIISQGTPEAIMADKHSLTGMYLKNYITKGDTNSEESI